MKPGQRKTGSLATCIPPSLRGHLVGVFVGNFVGNFVDTFVSISVSIFVYTTFSFCGRFRGACQIFRGGLRGYKTSVFLIFGNFRGPLSGLFVGRFVASFRDSLQERPDGQPRSLAS